MKKQYSQPNILFEGFSLCSGIAAGCAKKINTFANGDCGVPYGKRLVFTTEVSGCKVKVEDGSPFYDGLCYHVPVDMNALVNS